jgi:hypothetical protein
MERYSLPITAYTRFDVTLPRGGRAFATVQTWLADHAKYYKAQRGAYTRLIGHDSVRYVDYWEVAIVGFTAAKRFNREFASYFFALADFTCVQLNPVFDQGAGGVEAQALLLYQQLDAWCHAHCRQSPYFVSLDVLGSPYRPVVAFSDRGLAALCKLTYG